MPAIKTRRIVTGHDTSGKAIITSDGQPPNVRDFTIPGVYFTELWNTAGSPSVIDNGPDPTAGTPPIEPPTGGSRLRIVEIGPDMPQEFDDAAVKKHFAQAGSPDATSAQAVRSGAFMHRTETVDYGIVLEGEITLVMDESEVTLGPGDIVIQRGTNHGWTNRGKTPCRIAFVLLDARYSPEVKQAIDQRGAQL